MRGRKPEAVRLAAVPVSYSQVQQRHLSQNPDSDLDGPFPVPLPRVLDGWLCRNARLNHIAGCRCLLTQWASVLLWTQISRLGRLAAWRSSGPQPRSIAKRVLPASVMSSESTEAGFGYSPAMLNAMGPGRLAGRTGRLLRCGIWAGPVFTATFLAEGAARDGYRSLRHPVSSLALGPRGWVQTANFAVAGILCLADAAGLRRAADRLAGCRAGPVMVAAAGAGLIGSAVFRTDPVGGYPAGTPDMPARFSRAGIAHNLAAIPVFFGLPAAAASYGWRSWRARPAARLRDLLRCDRGDHASHHGAGRIRLWPVVPAGRLWWPVPAGQHHVHQAEAEVSRQLVRARQVASTASQLSEPATQAWLANPPAELIELSWALVGAFAEAGSGRSPAAAAAVVRQAVSTLRQRC